MKFINLLIIEIKFVFKYNNFLYFVICIVVLLIIVNINKLVNNVFSYFIFCYIFNFE